MKYKKSLLIIIVCITLLSLFVSVIGVFYSEGKGLYHDDSESVASQGIAQDIVTLFLPLLII